MQNKIFIIIILLLSLNAFSQIIDNINDELCIIIKNGTKENELLYDKNTRPMGPTAISIYKNKFIIADSLNSRLVIYDQYFNFIKSIKNETYAENNIFFPYNIKLDSKENIYLSQPSGFLKLKMNGEKNYYIERKQTILNEQKDYKFYIVDDIPYFYGKKELYKITEEGNIEKNIKKKMEQLNIFSTLDQNKNALNYLNNINGLTINNLFIPRDYKHFKEYIKSLKIEEKRNIKNVDLQKFYIDELIGIDDKENYYWIGYDAKLHLQSYIFVFSKEGNLTTCFENSYSFKVALNDSGDLFFLKSTEEGHYIYKIPRQW